MSIYFIHAEVLDGDKVVTKACAIACFDNANDAFDWFMDSQEVAKYKNKGRDVVIDKLEKVE
ncbi:hypothetical protein KGB50_gp45 [Shigella phage DS8]|uniref:Uncharacterized protein n=1 Tax=Shigella phage DS8 TaxID=2565502 RepID=A0A4P8MWM6_9CAUD|nr:hypothetical protein KGB50_gp45 [Shigella phage DS8]QCQ57328.1 hypothetical protein [Shigella phage DS8]